MFTAVGKPYINYFELQFVSDVDNILIVGWRERELAELECRKLVRQMCPLSVIETNKHSSQHPRHLS